MKEKKVYFVAEELNNTKRNPHRNSPPSNPEAVDCEDEGGAEDGRPARGPILAWEPQSVIPDWLLGVGYLALDWQWTCGLHLCEGPF